MGDAVGEAIQKPVTHAPEPRILVATEDGGDAELVCRLLRSDYPQVAASADPARFADDFEKHLPQVLVLAFKTIEAAERYYLGLYRHSSVIRSMPHRTLLLCSKDDLRRAYELCRKNQFDDYVLFWPMVHDAPRLPMSVHMALRVLEIAQAAAPLAQMAVQARRIAELETLLDQQLALGVAHADHLRHAARHAQVLIDAELGGRTERITDSDRAEPIVTREAAALRQRLGGLTGATLGPPLRQFTEAVAPMQRWIEGFKSQMTVPLAAVRELASQAGQFAPLLLVVDDDDFVRRLLSRVLGDAKYAVASASCAAEAIALLRTRRPELILMDVMLPDIDGITFTRQLKASASHAGIPVIMLTGQSERQVIVDSLDAGAADFIVKPFDREILFKKVARHLVH